MKKVSNNKSVVRSNLVLILILKVGAHKNQEHIRGTASPTTYRFWRRIHHRRQYLSRPTLCFMHSRAHRRLQANTSCRIKRSSAWYWWPPSRVTKSSFSVSVNKPKLKRSASIDYWHSPIHSAGPWRWRQTALKKWRVSLRGVYVWDVNSTWTVTKHSYYFVWKDTSERDSTLRRHQLTRSEWILVY